MLIYSEVLKYRSLYHDAAHAFVKMSGEVCDCSIRVVNGPCYVHISLWLITTNFSNSVTLYCLASTIILYLSV